MSTTTATFEHHIADKAATRAKGKSFYQRFIDARLRQGKAHANTVLQRMPDAQLAELGFSAEQISEIRATGSVPAGFWH